MQDLSNISCAAFGNGGLKKWGAERIKTRKYKHMKPTLKDLITDAARRAHQKGDLPSADIPEVEIEEPRAEAHGDFSCNIAMVMASIQKNGAA